jgi:hydrogenase maturation protease
VSPRPHATLILALGNPIAGDDQVGLRVGARLADELAALPATEMREFIGSPLDLVAEAGGFDQLVLLDAVCTGREIGTVISFTEQDLAAEAGDTYPHGLNVPEALALGRRMGLPLPARITLVGIEVGPVREFGDSLSPELGGKLDAITRESRRILMGLLSP